MYKKYSGRLVNGVESVQIVLYRNSLTTTLGKE